MSSDHAILAVLVLWSAATVADETVRDAARLEARPVTCVAVHRGQTCFKRIRLSWTAPSTGRLCVLRDGADGPLICWRDGARTDWEHDYASADGERYRLVVTDADGVPLDTLATTSVDTVWVYRGRRSGSGGWRLF